ncbi:MAG: hypothetical protein IJY61_06425 [Candidatus Gastranaerophilales bacterium]|nr:hypothetical protein [Candidatus Gastranaerophilales bacterium]
MQIQAIGYKTPCFSKTKLKQNNVQHNQNPKSAVAPFSSENLKAKFLPISFKGTPSRLEEFKKYTTETKLDNFIYDDSFYENPNFDASGWLEFFNACTVYDYVEDDFFLNIYINQPDFTAKLNNEEYSPRRAWAFIQEFLANEELQKDFCTQDLLFFTDYFAQTDYELDEFADEIIYFKSLKDKKGEQIFIPKFDVFEQSELIIYMMELDRGSVDASNFQMLLELVTNGEVDSNVLKFLPPNSKLNPDIISDIDKLYQAYSDNINPIDVFVPIFENDEEAKEKLNIGDVYQVKNTEKASIIGANGKIIPLNISREKYFELFPPIQRFATTQNLIGNCWELSPINALFSTPETRQNVLKLFSQEGDDIIVELPSSEYGKVIFKNSQMPQNLDLKYYSLGAKGFQMLEYADGKELYTQALNKFYYQTLIGSSSSPTKEDIELAERIRDNKKSIIDENSIVVEYDDTNKKWSISKFNKEKHGFNDPTTLSRHMGKTLTLFRNLGTRARYYSISRNDVQKALQKPSFFKEAVVCYSTKESDELSGDNIEEQIIDYSTGLLSSHAYRLLPADINKKGKITSYYLINPYGVMQVKLSKEKLFEYGHEISLAIKDKDED